MEPRAAAARELLLAALEDLSQEQLKRFRHKLRDAQLDGRSIPWGRLERADAVDLAEQLIHFYAPEPALEVARKALKRADVRDVAARLKEQRLQRERGRGRRSPPLHSVRLGRGRTAAPGFPLPQRSPAPRPPRPRCPESFIHRFARPGARIPGALEGGRDPAAPLPRASE